MVKIPSSKGGFVDVEITGIAETVRRLQQNNRLIATTANIGLIRAGDFMKSEVQESIIGNRKEQRSVETGLAGNSIEVDSLVPGTVIIQSDGRNYPGRRSDTRSVLTFLEFGTTRIAPRKHFTNSAERNKRKVRDIVEETIQTK